jgi:hypothetical protein
MSLVRCDIINLMLCEVRREWMRGLMDAPNDSNGRRRHFHNNPPLPPPPSHVNGKMEKQVRQKKSKRIYKYFVKDTCSLYRVQCTLILHSTSLRIHNTKAL